MRQLVSSLFRRQAAWAVVTFIFLGLVVAGCGHSSTKVVPTSITITPASSVSLKFGSVQSLSAQVLDNNGNVMSNQTFVWTSSNSNIATVTATGGNCGNSLNTTDTTCICGGTWNSDYTVCKEPPPATAGGPPQSGTATITVSADGLSTSITALVHASVARVAVTPNLVDCLSASGTQQMTAKAYDSQGNDITNQVAVDAGSFNWISSDSTVVALNTNGLATAVNPGRANVYSSIAGTTSAPASFTTCPVVSISLAVSGGSAKSFSIAQSATQQLTATITDSNNKNITVTSGRLSYNSSYPLALYSNTSGLVTAQNPGNSTIVASCSPPSCNNGLYPVYSNVVNGTTEGTTAGGTNSKSTQVLVASRSDTKLIPIDISTSTAGTALTLPYKPNSLVYSRAGSIAYMGSDTELMSYDPTTSLVIPVALIPGVIIDLSNSGGRIVIYNDPTKTVTIYSLGGGTIIDRFSAPNATPTNVHASTSPDDQTTYVVVGNQLFISSSTSSLRTITMNAPANDVAFSLQGSFAYLAGGENNAITARTTCDGSEHDVVATTAIPDRIIAGANGAKMYAVSGASMDVVTPTTDGAGCPPSLTDSLGSFDMGQGTISPSQMFSNSAGTKIYMITGTGKIVVYDTGNNSATSISLSGSATATTGALTMDGANLWVGGGADDKVHRIDTSNNSDAQQISVGISADLVAVRNE